ncbi:MAG: hypothetical protein GY861_03975 [bacterium]|nr:hypothetical protein [bacterium]
MKGDNTEVEERASEKAHELFEELMAFGCDAHLIRRYFLEYEQQLATTKAELVKLKTRLEIDERFPHIDGIAARDEEIKQLERKSDRQEAELQTAKHDAVVEAEKLRLIRYNSQCS